MIIISLAEGLANYNPQASSSTVQFCKYFKDQ